MIVILALLCSWLKRRKEMKEREKRMLGYYVPPDPHVGGQNGSTGTFHTFNRFHRGNTRTYEKAKLAVTNGFQKKGIYVVWPSCYDRAT